MRRSLLLLALLVVIVPQRSDALSVVFVDREELLRQSDAVIVATIGEERYGTLQSHGIEVTDTTVVVDEVLAGAPPAVLQFRKPGGLVPVPGVEQFEPGERCVLYLRVNDAGVWWLTAIGQSKMTLTDTPAGEIALRQLKVAAFTYDDHGNLVKYQPPGRPIRLSTLREELKR